MSREKKNPYSFLSMDNFKSLGQVIKNFMIDTYNIPIESIFQYDDFKEILQSVMTDIEGSNKTITMQEKNKLVIISVRSIIFERMRVYQEKKEIHTSQLRTLEKESENVGAHMPLPVPEMDRDIDDADSTKNDEVFFKKLQDLEQRRKAGLPTSQPTIPNPQTPIVATTSPSISQAVQPSIIKPSHEQVIVAVPPPPRHGDAYTISSWDRSLQENIERSRLLWTSTISTMADPLGTRVAGLFLPVSVSSYTPYVILSIEGASGANTSCILSPENSLQKARGWSRWIPMDNGLSYIRNVSSPWKIELRSADNVMLPLGCDISIIKSIRLDDVKMSMLLDVHPLPQDGEFTIGDQVWICTKKDRKKTEIISITCGSIEVRCPHNISDLSSEWTNARLLNYSRQWSLVLDITKSEHIKK